jgi:hypothetical protein
MKSRNLRTFTVEHKTKRRPTPTLPTSIWGHVSGLFSTTSDQANMVVPAPIDDMSPAPIRKTEAHGDIQVRRILPDLRATQVEVAEDVVAIRLKPRRVPRKRVETVQQDADKQSAHQVEQPSAITVETLALAEPDDTPKASFTREARGDIVVMQEPWSAVELAPAIGRPISSRRERTWTRKVDDLARGERWRRRLPEVCR